MGDSSRSAANRYGRPKTEIEEYQWHNADHSQSPAYKPVQMIVAGLNEKPNVRKTKFINQLFTTCMTCSCCRLGTEGVEMDGIIRDPHLLSNRMISDYMIILDRPTYDDIQSRDRDEINWVQRNLTTDVYITYLLKCCSSHPSDEEYNHCKAYIDMEVSCLKPKLIITMGPKPFAAVSGGLLSYTDQILKVGTSKYGIKMLTLGDLHDADWHQQISKLNKLLHKINTNQVNNHC